MRESPEVEKEWLDKWPPLLATIQGPPRLDKSGLTRVDFSPEEGKKFFNTYYEVGWELFAEVADPQYVPRLRELTGK